MKQWIKKYGWLVLLAGAGIAIGAYYFFKNPENQIKFGFASDDDLSRLLPSLERNQAGNNEKGIGLYFDVPLTTIIKNKSAKELTLNNLAGILSYEGEGILQTKGNSVAFKDIKVNAKSQKPVTDTFQVLVNEKTIKYVKEYLKGNKPKLNYNLNAMVLGDVYSFKDSAILNENIPPVTGEAT